MANNKLNIDPEGLRRDGAETRDVLIEIRKLLQDINKDAKRSGEAMSSFTAETQKTYNLAYKLSSFTKDQLKDVKEKGKFEKALNAAKNEQIVLESRINQLVEKGGANNIKRAKTLKDALDYSRGLTAEAAKLSEAYQTIDNKVKFFDNMADLVKDVPVLRKVFSEFKEAATAARDAVADDKNGFTAGVTKLGGAFGKAGLAFGVAKVVQGLKSGDERATLLARNLNISKDAGLSLQNSMQSIASGQTGVVTEEIAKATIEFSKYMGSAATFSQDNAIAMVAMTKQLGLSADTANKLAQYSAGTGKEVGKFTKEIIGSTLAQNVNNKLAIRYQDVLSDIANASSATRLSLEKYPGALEKAAYQARALGLSFAQLESSAGALLNFEQSIGAELDAELLTGKELNLDRARIAAEMNQTVILSQELAKNIGTSADFSKMSRTQQEGFAKAVGMSREQLADTLIQREALQRLGAAESDDIAQVYNTRLKEINAIKDKAQREKALANLNLTIGDKELAQQLKTTALAEAQKEAMEEIADAASLFADVLRPVVGFFQSIGKFAGTTLISVLAISAAFRMMSGRSMFAGMGNMFSGLTSRAGSIAGTAGAAAGVLPAGTMLNSAGRLIDSKTGRFVAKPAAAGASAGAGKFGKFLKGGGAAGGIASLAGMGISMYADTMEEGTAKDVTSTAGNIASYAGTGAMIGSLFGPGIGTAIGAGIGAVAGAGVAALNIMKANEEKEAELRRKDDENRAVVSKLDELIKVYQQGGNVYMDGNKVGNTMTMSMPKSS